jgi:hypothetical protein
VQTATADQTETTTMVSPKIIVSYKMTKTTIGTLPSLAPHPTTTISCTVYTTLQGNYARSHPSGQRTMDIKGYLIWRKYTHLPGYQNGLIFSTLANIDWQMAH